MYTGAADADGGFGCQIWVKKALKFRVSSYAAASPRLFWMTGRTAVGIPLILVSCHAPREGAEPRDRELFWDSLVNQVLQLQARTPTAKTFLGVDANGRVGAHASGATGPNEAVPFNTNGAAFAASLEAIGAVAINTYFDVGYTWRSGKGPTARVDYICGPLSDLHRVRTSWVPREVQLSLTAKEDHRMVAAITTVSGPGEPRSGGSTTFRINKWRLADAGCVHRFQSDLASLEPLGPSSVDSMVEVLMRQIRDAAMRSFGPPKDQPRQPWISADTWRALRVLAPSRRVVHAARAAAGKVRLHMAFLCWAAACHAPFAPNLTGAPTPPSGSTCGAMGRLGWQACCVLPGLRGVWRQWSRLQSMAWRLCQQLTRVVRHFIHFDRQLYLEVKAGEAQAAAVRGDWRTSFGIVRALGGRRAADAGHPVLLKCGRLSACEAERQARWLEHFCDVFKGTVKTMAELQQVPVDPPVASPTIRVSAEAVGAAVQRLGRNKGVGRDGVPAELLVAGGPHLHSMLAEVYQEIVDGERWPVQWTGGRMQNVYKNKGPMQDCDESRGIVLEDHAAKGLKQILGAILNDPYQQNMPEAQHGAVAGRGTDYAAHLVHCFMAYCAAQRKSCFVWFVDLVKAFDRAIREIVMGWPSGVDDPSQYLASLGLSSEQAEWIAAWVARHGCLFEQWQVCPKVIRLLKNMHAASWFSFGDVDSAVATLIGGRQGCKFGSMVFNGTFSLAMTLIRDALLDSGIVLRVRPASSAFWGAGEEPGGDDSDVPVLDAAFVDDECFMLYGCSAKSLDDAIETMLTTVCQMYDRLNLTINWKAGKSECFLVYRGAAATACLQRRRVREDGSLAVEVTALGVQLLVVPRYCHLGGVISADGSLAAAAQHLRASAAKAYGPLACKIFGSSVVAPGLKLWFMSSLILSRLLYNTHVLVPSRRFMVVLNGVYMRVLRRVDGSPRFGSVDPDLVVRERLKQPSIDCLLMRGRLRFFARLVRSEPVALMALLGTRPRGAPLPWVALLLDDLRRLRSLVATCSRLGDPEVETAAWRAFVLEAPAAWNAAVATLYFVDSCCDAAASSTEGGGGTRPFPCLQCPLSFHSCKARDQHMRIKHGVRCPQRFFAPADATCMLCKTRFGSRLRLLGHLCDRRRTKCWDAILGDPVRFPPLAAKTVEALDRADQEQRREAQRCGHSHALAHGPTRRSNGTVVGRSRL